MGCMSMEPEIRRAGSVVEEGDTAVLLRYLATHDVACPLCKYNLRGLVVPRCPECGKQIKLMVGLTDSYVAPFVTLLIALGLPAGVGVLACIVMLREGTSIYRFGYRPADSFGTLSLIGFQLSIVPLIVATVLRRRFFRLGRQLQWMIAVGGMLEAAAIFAMFFASVVLR